jgi:hypothetical protein
MHHRRASDDADQEAAADGWRPVGPHTGPNCVEGVVGGDAVDGELGGALEPGDVGLGHWESVRHPWWCLPPGVIACPCSALAVDAL